MGVILTLRMGHVIMAITYFFLGLLVGEANINYDVFGVFAPSLFFVVLVIIQFIIDTKRQNKRDIYVPPKP